MRDALRIVLPWEERSITFVGDPHLESPGHNRGRFIDDVEKACAHGDILWFMGDMLSYILPNDLRRSSGSHRLSRVNAEDLAMVDDILGEMVEKAATVLKPYVNHIEVIMVGNHETAVMKYHHFDPTRAIIQHLNQHKTDGVFTNKHIQHGGYTCWLQLQFVERDSEGKRLRSVSQKGWVHHGAGGSAKVTKGLIDFNRIKVGHWCDFAVIGHKHTQVLNRDRFEYMDDYGNVKIVDRDFAVVGGYSGSEEETYDPMNGGYRLDWSSESFYDEEAQGSVRFTFRPVKTHGGSKLRRSVLTPESW